MKLIFLLILAFLKYSIEATQWERVGYISKSHSYTSKTNSPSSCVYLDTNEFSPDISYIEIYVTTYNGRFTTQDMYYEYSNSLVSSIVLSTPKHYDYSSYSSYDYGYYDDFTYYFKIPKRNHRYLYLSILPTDGWNSRVEIGVSSGLAVWIIAVIVVAAIIIIGGIITTIICCRRRRYSYIAPVSGPIAPYSPMASPYPNVY